MAVLVSIQGPNLGCQYSCDAPSTSIGRQQDCAIWLESPAVSRQHAHIIHDGDMFFVEDLNSSNGTFVNGAKIEAKHLLTENDLLQIGPYAFTLRPLATVTQDPVVRSQISALSSSESLYSQNAAQKLRVVVEIGQSLGRTLEVKPLLDKLLEQLFRLFPQADRGMVLMCEGDQFTVGAQRLRHRRGNGIAELPATTEITDFPFSRSLARRALDEGVGLLSEDVNDDPTLPKSVTLMALQLRSFLCVPMIGLDGKRLGILQLDCLRAGIAFRLEDLEMLTAISLQVAGVIENAALHEERIREERLRRDIALAREIQQSFLPNNFAPLPGGGYELYARVHPAREVSGDLYDFFPQEDGQLALFLGDVSGKGMPAALFMIAVRTLTRTMARIIRTPGQLLEHLNLALVEDNPTNLFVTLLHATFDPATGQIVLVSGGHPAPLLRRPNGKVEPIALSSSTMLGFAVFDQPPVETKFTLQPGETLIFYSDGFTEAFGPGRTMFGVERLSEVLEKSVAMPLAECAEFVRTEIAKFTARTELQDDQTLLLLRRTEVSSPS